MTLCDVLNNSIRHEVPDGFAGGDPLPAIDSQGAGRGDRVMISSDGRGTRELVGDEKTPIRWSVLGICD